MVKKKVIKKVGLKLYKHKKDGSIILTRNLNGSTFIEIVGPNGEPPDFHTGKSNRKDYELCDDKVIIKTSTEWDLNKSFIICTNSNVFFHCERSKRPVYVSLTDSRVTISTCGWGTFTSHIESKKVYKHTMEFRNKKEKPKSKKQSRVKLSKGWSTTTGTFYTSYMQGTVIS